MNLITFIFMKILTFNTLLLIFLGILILFMILLYKKRDKIKENSQLITLSLSILSIFFVVLGLLATKLEESQTAEMIMDKKFN